MTRLAETEPMIGQAIDMEKMFLMDYKQRLAYILNLKTIMDEANHDASIERAAEEKGIEKGRAEGMEKGMEKGKRANAVEIAEKMLARGMEHDVVADLSGLTLEEVESLSRGE